MRERVVIPCLMTVGISALACSNAMDLGAVDEFPGAGAANGWQSFGQQPSESITLLHHRPTDLAVQDSRLFWTADREGWSDGAGVVQSCAVGDCPASSTTYETTSFAYHAYYPPSNVAVDETTVYWLRGGILHCPIAGCGGKPSVFDTGGNIPARMAIHGDAIYWTSVLNTGVFKCPRTGCVGPPQALALNQMCPFQIEVDGDSIYWVRTGAAGQVMKLAKSGGEPVELAGLQNQPDDLFVDDTFVYWTTRWAGGSLFRCPKAGCAGAPETVLANQQKPGTILGDATSLYWIASPVPTPYDGTAPEELHTCSKSDCAHTHRQLATMNASSECRQRIAQDDLYVYWTENPDLKPRDKGSGRIKRIRK